MFDGVFWHEGFNVLVQVDRTSVYYIFLIIIPQRERSAGKQACRATACGGRQP